MAVTAVEKSSSLTAYMYCSTFSYSSPVMSSITYKYIIRIALKDTQSPLTKRQQTFTNSKRGKGLYIIMSKSGVCGCGATVTIPKSECLFRCHSCQGVSVFLCHLLGEINDPLHIRCKECRVVYSMYNCPQCEAFAVVKGFQSGKMYNCLCGFQATMVTCAKCNGLLCLPTKNNYELTPIVCKKCQHSFAYRLCPACSTCTYLRPEQLNQQAPACLNDQCQLFQVQTQPQPQMQIQMQKQAAKEAVAIERKVTQSNPYEQLMPVEGKKESELCNICLNREKCMINTTCYHLSVCEQCSRDLQGRCPICRTVGQYKMVFRS